MRPFLKLAFGACIALVVFLLGVYALRDRLATIAANAALERMGGACDALSLDVAWSFGSVRIAPTTCRFPAAQVPVVAAPAGLDVVLTGLRPTSIVAPELRVEVPIARIPDGAAIAFLDTSVTPPVADALQSAAELAGRDDVPDVRIGELNAKMGDRMLTVHGLSSRRAPSGELLVSIASVGAAESERGRVDLGGHLETLEGRANVRDASLHGKLVIDLDLGPDDLDRSVPFEVAGASLDTSRPRFQMLLERGERMNRLRAAIYARARAGAHATRRSESPEPRGSRASRGPRE